MQAEKTGTPCQGPSPSWGVRWLATATTAYGWPKRNSATRFSPGGGSDAREAKAVTAAASNPVRVYRATADWAAT